MTDIREQIEKARIFAALSRTKATHHLCGKKITLLADTMEKMLAALQEIDTLATEMGKQPAGSVNVGPSQFQTIVRAALKVIE